jgi:hypothetical protein
MVAERGTVVKSLVGTALNLLADPARHFLHA